MNTDQLREEIFSAVAANDGDTLVALCSRHRALILECFPDWVRMPGPIRTDPSARDRWAQGLITVARYFEATGDPALLDTLAGGDNPLTRWRQGFARASQLSEAGEFAEAAALLLALLSELQGAAGPAVDDLRPKMYGLLGTVCFRLGDVAGARRHTAAALEDSRRASDREGVRVYTENLRVIETLAGAPDVAASVAAGVRAEVARAQDLSDRARYEASNAVLEALMTRMDADPADAGKEYLGKIYGLLGLNFVRLGHPAVAQQYTALALQLCTAAGDDEGVRIYSANLDTISARMAAAGPSPSSDA
jgi:hypothetical protein